MKACNCILAGTVACENCLNNQEGEKYPWSYVAETINTTGGKVAVQNVSYKQYQEAVHSEIQKAYNVALEQVCDLFFRLCHDVTRDLLIDEIRKLKK